MSDSAASWVIPALLVVVLVGVTTVGFALPNSRQSPESIVDDWKKSSLGQWLDDKFSRERVQPCTETPRPACCVGPKLELEGTCMLAIAAGKDGSMRRVGLRAAKSPAVRARVEAFAKGEKHTQELEWKAAGGNRTRATADFGPEPVALVIQCAEKCAVEFE